MTSSADEVTRDPVDVILLAYNRLDYLQQMVDALEQRTQWPYRLTIIDNLSGPATRQWLRRNRDRFHQVIWNRRNEHLAGYQRGIAATDGSLFVLSDADVIPHPPAEAGCWLTRLVRLSERHPDFGLIGTRLDSLSDARNLHLEHAPIVAGEIIEAATGVWLNLMRREALKIPYISDGITCYALRRSGYRVGVASDIYSLHLGDQDPLLHPAYLAGKQAASGVGTVYPSYPELRDAGRPATLAQIALAAPLTAALRGLNVAPEDTVELSRKRWPPIGSAQPGIESCVRGRRTAAAVWSYAKLSPLAAGGAVAVALVCADGLDDELLADAFAGAAKWVALLTSDPAPQAQRGWELQQELPGPHPVPHRLAKLASGRRWRHAVGYSTSEEREHWLRLFEHAAFSEDTHLRAYIFARVPALPTAKDRWLDPRTGATPVGDGEIAKPERPSWSAPMNRSGRAGAWLTKLSRLLRVEWRLRHTRR